MKFKLERSGVVIIPETEQDVAYIEDTLGLKNNGDSLLLERQDRMGLLELLKTKKVTE